MKQIILALALAAGVAGCNSNNQSDRALVGGTVGAVGGALVGAAINDDGSDAEAALIGGAIGGVAGAVVGAATTPDGRCFDQNGNVLPPGRYRNVNGEIITCT